MASKIVIKRSVTAAAPAGLSYGEMAFIQGSGLTANQFYVGISGGNPVWVGAQIGTTGTWTDNAAKTSLATQYATDQRRISSSVSSFNGLTGAVTGASLGANTFTALNSFNAGISASGGTFTSDIHIIDPIVGANLTVGFGGGGVYSNMVFGAGSLGNNTIGGGNAAIGFGALGNNTEGSNNIAIGSYSLVYNRTGSDNIAIGPYTMKGSVVGIANPGPYNIGIGTEALGRDGFIGDSNVAIGYNAGKNATTASRMTALGYAAGVYYGAGILDLTTGTGGIYIGYQARAGGIARTNEIVIGVDARGLGSNTAVIGATLQSAATIYGVLNLPSGLSASGATFTGSISGATATFSKDITVNSMTIGRGGASNIDSVAFGYNALGANTDGTSNLAIGYNALGSNTDGEENVAIGRGTLQNTAQGFGNIAIGSLALGGGSVGSYNIAIGRSALGAAGNTASFNTGIGFQSLQANTTGTNNTGIGYQSLYNDTTGLDNTGIGTNTLKALTTGSYNTGVGSSAFRSLSTASQMTALGNNAGRYRGTGTDTNTTGTGGIYIGYQARGSTLAQTNEIVIGVDALGLGSNTAVIGATTQSAATVYGVLNLPSGLSASGATFTGSISGATATFSKDITVNSMTVGIGSGGQNSNVVVGFAAFGSNTNGIRNVAVGELALGTNTEGSSNVGVGRAALASNTTGGFNIGVGRNALYSNTEGSNNVGVGQSALYSNTTGSFNVGVGYGAGEYIGTGESSLTTGTGGIYIGYQARGSTLAQTNEIVIGVNALGLGSNTAVIGATLQSAATIYGLLNLPSGLSASGATLSGTVITSEKVNAITSARTVTVNFQNGNIQTLTGLGSGATGSSAIGFTGASATGSSTVTMIITNGGLMTSNTTFWSTAVKWPGGFKTTLSTSGVDILTFTTIDAGTNIYGMLGGKAFS